jgi:hypothetical protein
MTVHASKGCSLGFQWKAGAEGNPVLPLPCLTARLTLE